jgi:hypothetical protein
LKAIHGAVRTRASALEATEASRQEAGAAALKLRPASATGRKRKGFAIRLRRRVKTDRPRAGILPEHFGTINVKN